MHGKCDASLPTATAAAAAATHAKAKAGRWNIYAAARRQLPFLFVCLLPIAAGIAGIKAQPACPVKL